MKRFGLVLVVMLAAMPVLAQVSKGDLANLIEAGNRKAALERLRGSVDVNEAQPDGTRPIHWAVYRVDYELLQALIAKKANLNVRNEFGAAPLSQAAELGDVRMVKMLLDAGAEVEGANPDGQTALMLAIKTGETAVVELLVKAGANVNAVETSHRQTPLMWAATASRNAGALVKLLLARGADVKPRALYTDWPSQITAEPRAQYRPVGGLTALLYAARDGCYDCVEALLGAGANVNVPTPEGVTALMLALDNDHNDVAKLLLERGASPSVWDWWGRTALYIAVDRKACAKGSGQNCDPRARPVESSGVPAFVPRAAVSSLEIINALLAADVDPSPQLNFHRPSRSGNNGRFVDPLLNTGCTPLLRATMAGDAEVVRALLDKGANPNINAMGLTPFLVAAGVGAGNRGGTGLAATSSAGGPVNMDLMEQLRQHGADVNAQVTGTLTYSMRVTRAPSSNEGMTALHIAAQTGRTDVVRYLLANGANTEIKDAGGHRALDLVSGGPGGNAAPATGANGAASQATAEIRSLLAAAPTTGK